MPVEWLSAVTEGSRTDLLAPAEVMADVAAEVFDLDRRRFEAHRNIVELLRGEEAWEMGVPGDVILEPGAAPP